MLYFHVSISILAVISTSNALIIPESATQLNARALSSPPPYSSHLVPNYPPQLSDSSDTPLDLEGTMNKLINRIWSSVAEGLKKDKSLLYFQGPVTRDDMTVSIGMSMPCLSRPSSFHAIPMPECFDDGNFMWDHADAAFKWAQMPRGNSLLSIRGVIEGSGDVEFFDAMWLSPLETIIRDPKSRWKEVFAGVVPEKQFTRSFQSWYEQIGKYRPACLPQRVGETPRFAHWFYAEVSCAMLQQSQGIVHVIMLAHVNSPAFLEWSAMGRILQNNKKITEMYKVDPHGNGMGVIFTRQDDTESQLTLTNPDDEESCDTALLKTPVKPGQKDDTASVNTLDSDQTLEPGQEDDTASVKSDRTIKPDQKNKCKSDTSSVSGWSSNSKSRGRLGAAGSGGTDTAGKLGSNTGSRLQALRSKLRKMFSSPGVRPDDSGTTPNDGGDTASVISYEAPSINSVSTDRTLVNPEFSGSSTSVATVRPPRN